MELSSNRTSERKSLTQPFICCPALQWVLTTQLFKNMRAPPIFWRTTVHSTFLLYQTCHCFPEVSTQHCLNVHGTSLKKVVFFKLCPSYPSLSAREGRENRRTPACWERVQSHPALNGCRAEQWALCSFSSICNSCHIMFSNKTSFHVPSIKAIRTIRTQGLSESRDHLCGTSFSARV